MIADTERAVARLLVHLQSKTKLAFTADAISGAQVLSNVSSFDGLISGIPVFGPGSQVSTVIDAFDVEAETITLSRAVTDSATAGSFTAGFQTFGRRVPFWDQVQGDYPALFVRHTGDNDTWAGEDLPITTADTEIWIYSKLGESPELAPDSGLSPLVLMVRTALTLPASYGEGPLDLGDDDEEAAAYRYRIEGQSLYDPGDQDKYAKAVIPARILLPSYPYP